MKYLLLAFLVLPVMLHAQFATGDKFIGGTFDFVMTRSPYIPALGFVTKEDNISIQPQLGFLVNEKLALGISLEYSKTKYTFGPDSAQGTNTLRGFSPGLFLKKYNSITDKFFFAINGGIDYSSQLNKSTNNGLETESKSYSISAGIRPSFLFFPSDRWGIEAGIGHITFTHSKTLDSDFKIDIFNLNYGSILLGFAYYFHKINVSIK